MKSQLVLTMSPDAKEPSSREELKELLDSEMGLLDEWLRSQGAGALTSFEDAMLRTYLVQKLKGALEIQSPRGGIDSMVTIGASVDPTTASRQCLMARSFEDFQET